MILSKIEISQRGTPEEDMHFFSICPAEFDADRWTVVAALFVEHCARNANVDSEVFFRSVEDILESGDVAGILKRHN